MWLWSCFLRSIALCYQDLASTAGGKTVVPRYLQTSWPASDERVRFGYFFVQTTRAPNDASDPAPGLGLSVRSRPHDPKHHRLRAPAQQIVLGAVFVVHHEHARPDPTPFLDERHHPEQTGRRLDQVRPAPVKHYVSDVAYVQVVFLEATQDCTFSNCRSFRSKYNIVQTWWFRTC